METKIGHIYEYSDSRIRIIYTITGIEGNNYIMTKILLYDDRRSLVNDNYRLPVNLVNEQIQRGIITQIHPAPPAPTIRVKFFDGNTREIPVGWYVVQYWNAGEWQNIEAFPDTLEGNKKAQELMNDWEWESQLIKLT